MSVFFLVYDFIFRLKIENCENVSAQQTGLEYFQGAIFIKNPKMY